MSQRQAMTLHPNRVYVKDLPLEVGNEDLKSLFSGFGFRIRSTRVVETTGATNYGFLTFDSREAAEEVIRAAQSEPGILLHGKKLVVDHAYSRRIPPRRNSRQFSQAIQSLCGPMNSDVDAGIHTPQQQRFMRSNFDHSAYAMSTPPNQSCASPQSHYSMQTSQQYANLCYDGRQVFFAAPNSSIAALQNLAGVNPNGPASLPQNAMHEEQNSANQWHLHDGHHFHHYQSMENPHSRLSNVQASYIQHGVHNQLYVEDPAEGVEAPQMPEWPLISESAATQRSELMNSTAYHRPLHEYTRHEQAQAHHQAQLLQQHLAQQQNLTQWYHHQYAMHPQCSSPNSEAGSSNIYHPGRTDGPEIESVDGE